MTSRSLEEARREVSVLPGLKEDELRRLGPCAVCGRALLEGGQPTFYVLEVSHAALDTAGLRRRYGLGLMMGSDALARVMGPNEDLAKVFAGPRRVVLHEGCAGDLAHVGQVLEAAKE